MRLTSVAVSLLTLITLAPVLRAEEKSSFDIVEIERPRILAKAEKYLSEEPVTVTASHSDRSAGGRHDYFSEGDYWWPDPKNPDGPYIQHDGLSNTNNFVEHRHAMVRPGARNVVATMTSADILTGDEKYAQHAVKHLKAWFVDEDTKMNPNLLYSQAIKGVATGRSTGVIDTIHLVEVARSVQFAEEFAVVFCKGLRGGESVVSGLSPRGFTTSPRMDYLQVNGDAQNNHGICWSMRRPLNLPNWSVMKKC